MICTVVMLTLVVFIECLAVILDGHFTVIAYWQLITDCLISTEYRYTYAGFMFHHSHRSFVRAPSIWDNASRPFEVNRKNRVTSQPRVTSEQVINSSKAQPSDKEAKAGGTAFSLSPALEQYDIGPTIVISGTSSSANVEPTSSANVEPTSSANVEPTSSANVEPASSANVEPASPANVGPASSVLLKVRIDLGFVCSENKIRHNIRISMLCYLA